MGVLLDPFFWFGLVVIGFAARMLVKWAASGGRLPLRGKRGSASALSGAGLAGQAFYQPGARVVQEMKQKESLQREDDDEGDPPVAGEESVSAEGPGHRPEPSGRRPRRS